MKYYLKKCTGQELGSIEDGKAQRGRYLYISINDEVLAFFPPLSTAHLNDSAIVAVVPLYSAQKVYCNFVYHNDKYYYSTAKHKRNEYRLYLNKALENYQMLFSKGDIIVVRQEQTSNIEDTDTNTKQTLYLLDLVKERGTKYYEWLDNEISNHSLSGGHGLYDGEIAEFESKVDKLREEPEIKVAVDKSVTDTINKTGADTLANLFNAVSFRDFVMVGYENLCAITGTVIRYESYMNLEAAHIRPKSRGGLYLPSNGIAMCRDMHWAFDKGFFTITDSYSIKVHPETTSEWLLSFNDKQIRIPSEPFFRPAVDNIRYHRENIFGLFNTTGRL